MTIRSVAIYEYDRRLRPGEIGVDFIDTEPNGDGDYTKRYEDDAEGIAKMNEDVLKWIRSK